MKKIILSAITTLVVASFILISCKSKNDKDAITPKYKNESGGGNPYYDPMNVTTTGTTAATGTHQSSVMTDVGVGSEWLSSGCTATITTLSNTNSSTGTIITISFLSTPTAGAYTLVSSQNQLTAGKAFMTVYNPPGQDANTSWYSSGGTCNVAVNGTAITATFNNIACYQSANGFYSVTVSGQVGCL
jgi:hypothetical protein